MKKIALEKLCYTAQHCNTRLAPELDGSPVQPGAKVCAFLQQSTVGLTLITISHNPLSATYDSLTGLFLKAQPSDYVREHILKL